MLSPVRTIPVEHALRRSCALIALVPWLALAESVHVNGVHLQVIPLAWNLSLSRASAELAARWGTPRLVHSPDHAGEPDRVFFARQVGSLHQTLTLRSARGSSHVDAIIAVQDLRLPPGQIPVLPFPVPAGTRIVNVVQHGDAVDAPLTFTLASRLAPRETIGLLGFAAQQAGWQVFVPPGAGALLAASRSTARFDSVAVPDAHGSRLLIHIEPRS
jgi:hypothetical protein